MQTRSTRARAGLLVATLLLFVFAWLTGGPARAQASSDLDSTPVAGEVTLERRLLAPCCWDQTLDVHSSEIASSLRHEIRTRLRAGEAAGGIEEDLVARYGERVRAVAKGQDPGGAMPFVVAAGVVLVGAALILMLRRMRRAGARALGTGELTQAPSGVDAYDARIDDELRAMEE